MVLPDENNRICPLMSNNVQRRSQTDGTRTEFKIVTCIVECEGQRCQLWSDKEGDCVIPLIAKGLLKR